MSTRGRTFHLAPVLILILALASTAAASQRNFRAHLAGRNEVPAVGTRGQGEATFKLSRDGNSLSFKLIVANIEDVTQAHIHCGQAGVIGPVVVFLFGLDPTGVSPDGVLSEGVITAEDVIARPASTACPGGLADFDDLIAHMRAGNTYTNVHTILNPGGEIRGQNR